MPMRKDAYPLNWKDISKSIRFERAKGCCEQCGVRHGSYIVRVPGLAKYLYFDTDEGCYREPDGSRLKMSELPEGYDYDHLIRVILTVHHIGIPHEDGTPGDPHDKMDVRPDNLIALCQRCHLRADMPTHVKNAKATRQAKKEQRRDSIGQKRLW